MKQINVVAMHVDGVVFVCKCLKTHLRIPDLFDIHFTILGFLYVQQIWSFDMIVVGLLCTVFLKLFRKTLT